MDNITKPVIMEFSEISKGKYQGVRHYELTATKNGNPVLPEKVNISKDRQFSKSKASYWLKIREDNKWSKCLTGLFPTSNGMVYYGDTEKRKNFLLFIFTDSDKKLTIYFFSKFYPKKAIDFIKRFFIYIIQKGSD